MIITIKTSNLKNTVSKLNLAIEKTKINPKSGWIEMEKISDTSMSVKVANYDYYTEFCLPIACDCSEAADSFHATISSDTFVPLASKIDCETVTITERLNAVILTTNSSEYTFPIIKDGGTTKGVDVIEFDARNYTNSSISGNMLSSVADKNAKGLVDTLFTKDIQQFIYLDEKGALTYTENIYLNDFTEKASNPFKVLLNCTQSKLLKIFEGYASVAIKVETSSYDSPVKCEFTATGDLGDSVKMVFVIQSQQLTDKFPSIKLRDIASAVSQTHAVIDKKALDRALARLMVFDKKFDISVLNYSQLCFEENYVKLVSLKNKNYEIIQYNSHTNTSSHTSMIRFADIVNQLKAVTSKDVDISYGDKPAIVINSDGLKQLIPEVREIQRA